MTNTYRWDFATVAALVAPRPLLLGNSDEDDIFPVPGYRRLAEKVRKIYDLYGAGSKFVLSGDAGQARGHARTAGRRVPVDEPLAQGRLDE